MKCEMKAKTPLNPTEEVEKIITALSNVFDYDELEIGDDYVSVSGGKESLLKLKDQLEKRRIRNSARQIMKKEAHDKVVLFKLSKQAALAGVVNFAEHGLSPLGEIKVKIETDNVDRFIEWMAPLQT